MDGICIDYDMGVCWGITSDSSPWCGCQEDYYSEELCLNDDYVALDNVNMVYTYVNMGYVVAEDISACGNSWEGVLQALLAFYYQNTYFTSSDQVTFYTSSGYVIPSEYNPPNIYSDNAISAHNCYLYCSDLNWADWAGSAVFTIMCNGGSYTAVIDNSDNDSGGS